MAENYSLDRTAFSAYKAEESKTDYSYWKGQSLEERLKAANYLIASAYSFDIQNPPKFDKTVFKASKRS